MIAIDTSALMAVLLGEPEADACTLLLEGDDDLLLSAGTLAEALIVASRRNVWEEMARLVDELGFEIVSVTPAGARRVAQAYQRWGKGLHPAGLNFGVVLRTTSPKNMPAVCYTSVATLHRQILRAPCLIRGREQARAAHPRGFPVDDKQRVSTTARHLHG